MNLVKRFTGREYTSYEDFVKNYTLTYPPNFNFAHDVVDEIAKECPDQKALLWCNDKGDERLFTFKDISQLSNKAANAFRKLGVKKGDKVLLVLKRHYQYWIYMMALHKLGACAIPATHLLTAKDIAYRVERAGIKMIITSHDDFLIGSINGAEQKVKIEIKAMVNGAVPGFIDIDSLVEKESADFERLTGDDAPGLNDSFIIYFTSGTTGMPKMVRHNFKYPLGHIITAAFWQNLKETDIHLSFADSGWAKCSWGKMYGQWICGACVFVYDYDTRFLPIDLIKMIEKHHITTFCAPPSVYRFLIKEDIEKFDLSSLRASFNAGEPLNPEVYKRWKDITGIKLREGFGQTETFVLLANFPWIEPKPGSTGKPSPLIGLELINSNGERCEVGEEGEICINIKNGIPEGIFTGYYREKAMTDSVMFDGFYHTGDVAWMDEDGYFWFIGRSDDVIKSSGYRIGPFEVESALLEHKAVLETAITAVPDEIRGQVVKATIVLAKGYEPSEQLKKELQDHVKRVTAPYKYPRIVEFVDELPKTQSGKIKRGEIRKKDHKN